MCETFTNTLTFQAKVKARGWPHTHLTLGPTFDSSNDEKVDKPGVPSSHCYMGWERKKQKREKEKQAEEGDKITSKLSFLL